MFNKVKDLEFPSQTAGDSTMKNEARPEIRGRV
jgi:hypothetical protein